MPVTDWDKTVALAGLCQAIFMVRDIARTGLYDGDDFATCINSLFKIDATDSADVYGGLFRLKSGLRLANEQLRHPQDMDATRYMLGIFALERKLSQRPEMLEKIRSHIDEASRRLEHFPSTHDNVIAGLASTYLETVSTLTPRILVNGEQVYLRQADHANRIRALLLAAIRAAILWRQSGGSRWTMVFKRSALIQMTERLLKDLPRQPPPPNPSTLS